MTETTSRFPAGPRTPSPYLTRVSPERTDGYLPPQHTAETPFGPISYTLGTDGAVYWESVYPGTLAHYADDLPPEHPQYSRQFLRGIAPLTINGKTYTLSGKAEPDRWREVRVTTYPGMSGDLTPAARAKLAAWFVEHWGELHPVAGMAGAELAQANRRVEDTQRTLADAEAAHAAAVAAATEAETAAAAALARYAQVTA